MSVTIKGSGQVPVQVIQTVKTDTFSMTGTTFTDITGLSVSITPTSASNRILVLFSTLISMNGGYYSGGIRLLRDSTPIYIGDADGIKTQATGWGWAGANSVGSNSMSNTFLDSPATTSAVTYKLQLVSGYSGQTVFVNRSYGEDNAIYAGRTPSSITVMEISG